MPEAVKVVFRSGGKHYFFSTNDIEIVQGQWVVVETEQGAEIGKVISAPESIEKSQVDTPLKQIIRTATEADQKTKCENKHKASEYFQRCKKLIRDQGMAMKLISAELSLDGKRVTFYFTAEQRVDFRELLKKLCSEIKKKIELKQVGVRDEARITGGFGACGCFMCCNQFISDFEPVSIKMAKEQNLPLNPNKISGACGRLMCCLKYEFDHYHDFMKKAPQRGRDVKIEQGRGRITDFNAIKQTAIVTLETGLHVEVPISELKK